jgi:hypothetical protein
MSPVEPGEPPRWTALVRASELTDTWLGITADDAWWVARPGGGPGRPADAADWSSCWPLLRFSADELRAALEKAAGQNKELPPFPYENVLASALQRGGDEWLELAVNQLEANASLTDEVVRAARDLARSGRASQRVRQRAERVVRTQRVDAT